ncbi:hypothetical protein OIU78_027844 [Salix suchowensis]|nr:hypothetical protein OIU78_027844 [Salix suchowensis]
MEEQSSNNNYSQTGKELECQRTSPVSILEPSLASGSCSYLNENQNKGMESNEEEYSKLAQKLLFDCVSESLDFKCIQTFSRSCKAWAKLSTLFQRKGWLAEELCKEILGWQSMGDLMVDELVDHDMSTSYGKWLDFSIEAFKDGVEIEDGILMSLVDELVSECLPM